MSKKVAMVAWLGWFVVAAPLPAYANNPPAPDSMLSIILLFPVAIYGFLFAGAKLTEKERKWRPVRGIVLGASAVLTAAGTAIAIIPLVILLWYGVRRGAQAMSRGQGAKRFAIGSGMILYTLFAVANYMAGAGNVPITAKTEGSGADGMRSIVNAETTFKSAAILDVNKNGIPEFGTLAQLQGAGLLPNSYVTSPSSSYRYVLELTGDPARDEKAYFVYAMPKQYGRSSNGIRLSLLNWWPHPTQASRTFAADEGAVIRYADLGSSRPVTREETQKWQPVE